MTRSTWSGICTTAYNGCFVAMDIERRPSRVRIALTCEF